MTLNVQSADPLLTVIDGAASFGTITALDTGKALDIIKVVVDSSALEGAVLPMSVLISGTGFGDVSTTLSVLVSPKVTRQLYTHSTGKIQLSVSNWGAVGLGPNLGFPAGGVGFKFNASGNQLLEGGLMIGTGFGQVPSAVHSISFEPDRDFTPVADGNLQVTTAGSLTITRSMFTDDGAASPIGVEVTQETFGQAAPNDDFLIIRYIVKNISGSAIPSMYVGLYMDWETPYINQSPAPNCGAYDATNHVAWVAQNSSGTKSDFRGAKVIEGDWASAWTALGSTAWIPFWGGNGFTSDEKYTSLTNGFATATTQIGAATDIVQVVSAGPISLAPNAVDTVSFAILAGNTESDIISAAFRANSVPADSSVFELNHVDVDGVMTNVHVMNTLPVLTWGYGGSPVGSQTQFEIAVGSDNEWTYSEMWNPAPVVSSDTFVVYNGSPLSDGQTYYLRLRVYNGTLWSPWYYSSFRMNSVPAVPVMIGPINMAIVGSYPNLWVSNSSDAENDPLTYDFAGFHDTDCVAGPAIELTNVPSGQDSTAGAIIEALAENCRYWWRVRAFDGFEYSAWTSYGQFLVNGANEPPAAFALTSPPMPDNKPVFNLLPQFVWQTAVDLDPQDTVRYKLEVSDRANFAFAYVRDSLLANVVYDFRFAGVRDALLVAGDGVGPSACEHARRDEGILDLDAGGC